MNALLGKKIGMTQIFNEEGAFVPVTIIEAGPCTVLNIKEKAVQIGFEKAREKTLKKPIAGYFKKIGMTPLKVLREIPKEQDKEYKVGEEIKVDVFKAGDFVDVVGTSIGKGFAGGMKRWNWSGGPMSHGSTSRRRVGSIGSTTDPGRVWKGHRMHGHLGNERITVQNLKVVKVDPENNLIAIKGAVPGHEDSYLLIRKAKKKVAKATASKE